VGVELVDSVLDVVSRAHITCKVRRYLPMFFIPQADLHFARLPNNSLAGVLPVRNRYSFVLQNSR
jgi:hypothetical protein